MKKYLIVAALTIMGLPALCQSSEGRRTDSLRLDSVKKMLPLLKGSDRVDALLLIVTEFQYLGPGRGLNFKKDTINNYITMAYDESVKIGYKPGIAKALLLLREGKDDATKQKNIREAIRLGEETKNNEVLGWAYYALGDQKKAVSYFQKAGNSLRELEVSCWLCGGYAQNSKNDDDFKYCEQSMILAKKDKSPNSEWKEFLVLYSLSNMADLYKTAGDYKTAMNYLRRASQYSLENKYSWSMNDVMSDLHASMGQYDSALYYQQKEVTTPNNPYVKIRLGRIYYQMKDYKKALPLLQQGIDSLIKSSTKPYFGKCLIDLGKAYAGNKQFTTALKYAKEGFNWFKRFESVPLPYSIEAHELFAEVYHQLKKDNLAYLHLKQFSGLKDSLQNKQWLWRLNNQLYKYKQAEEETKKAAQIGFLNRDNKIKEQQLKQEAQQKNFLFLGLLGFIISGFFVFRWLTLKRKNERLRLQKDLEIQQLANEKQHSDLQRKASELEMQALRAQMNPHFIFNCLSSINRFILKNEIEIASDYLTRFSRLIRMVLIHSQKSLISLEDELEILKLYLDMERLRFKDAFDYNINFTNRIDAGAVYIPPLLLQPFCENAIWHGLMHKEEKGHLNIALSMENKVLHCCISDDGIGREKASQFKSKSAEKDKSLGLKITTERLALLNGENTISTFYEINDILDEDENVVGTKVDLKIKYRESMQEYI